MRHQIKDFIYISAVLITLLFSVVLLDSFTGALVLDLNQSGLNVSETIIDSTISNIEELIDNQSIENSTITEITNSSIENVGVENVTNSSDSMSPQEIAETNASTQNSTIIENETEITGSIVEEIVENETVAEIIEEPLQNITEPLENVTETPEPVQNVTQPKQNVTNITQTNQTQNITIPEVNISVENATIIEEKVVQYQAVIGQPVKWKKTIKLDQESSNLEINLPKDIEITSVQKIENNQKFDITDEVINPSSILTGLAFITGFAVLEEPNATSLIIEQSVEEIEIEYETEAPQVFEEELSSISKIITVYSNTHYENILTFTEIPEAKSGSINLYILENGIKVSHPITEYVDSNNNGKIDEIYWITPHLSNQSFQVDITILNVQSYPDVNGNWTVNFTTNGTANLTITPINGTTYGINESSSLEFLELSCGSTILSPQFNGSAVFYQDFNCNNIGQHTAKVLSRGTHTLKFEFGNDTEYAFNLAGFCDATTPCDCGDALTANRTLSGADAVTVITCPGNGIDINNSGIELNCAGSTITGSGTGIGINFSRGVNRSTVIGCVIRDFDAGVHLEYNATMNYIRLNNISSNDIVGINISHEANHTNTSYNFVFQNGITTTGTGIYMTGYNYSSEYDTVYNNTVVGYHLFNASASYISTSFSNESGILDGYLFEFVNATNLSDIAARGNNRSGIRLANSSRGNWVNLGSYEYNALRNDFGSVEIDDNSTDNLITNNSMQHNVRGLVVGRVQTSENNTFQGNTFNNNSYAHAIINNSLNNTFIQQTLPAISIVANSTTGSINFTSNVTITSRITFIQVIGISPNQIFVNSTNQSGLNVSANLLFKNITFADPRPIVDTEDDEVFRNCTAPECNELGFTGNVFIYNVSHFTNYSSEDTPAVTTPGPTGGGNPSRPWIPSKPTPKPQPPAPAPAPAPPAPVAKPPTVAKPPSVLNQKDRNRQCWNNSGLSSSDFAVLDTLLSRYGCGNISLIKIKAEFEEDLLNINLGDKAKIGVDYSERLPLFSLLFGEEGHLESPFKARYINWLWLLILILAILLVSYLIKKEWQYLRKDKKVAPQIRQLPVPIQRPQLIAKPILEAPEFLPKQTSPTKLNGLTSFITSKLAAIQLPKLKLPRINLPKASIKLPKRIARKIEEKVAKESVLLTIEKEKKVRTLNLQELKSQHLDVSRKLEETRHIILAKINLSETELSSLETKFKSPLPSMPELQPHPQLKEVPRHVNDTAQFNYLYSQINKHLQTGDLITANRDYLALLQIYNQLIREISNKEDLYNVIKSVHARLSSAILAKRYGKLEDLNA